MACSSAFGVGTRLSFAVVILAFLFSILLFPSVTKGTTRAYLLLLFSTGLLLSLLPTITFFAFAPEQFVFGNLHYARLNTLYRSQGGYVTAMSPIQKLAYFKEVIAEPANLLLCTLLAVIAIRKSTVKLAIIRGKAFDLCLCNSRSVLSVDRRVRTDTVLVSIFLRTGSFRRCCNSLRDCIASVDTQNRP